MNFEQNSNHLMISFHPCNLILGNLASTFRYSRLSGSSYLISAWFLGLAVVFPPRRALKYVHKTNFSLILNLKLKQGFPKWKMKDYHRITFKVKRDSKKRNTSSLKRKRIYNIQMLRCLRTSLIRSVVICNMYVVEK